MRIVGAVLVGSWVMPRLLWLSCAVVLAGCALTEKISPYKLDTQQGHVLPPEAVARLKTGMTRERVRFILGTPLLNDMFNPDRLYYIYRNQKGDGPIERGNLTLYFEQNKLVRIDTDLVPQPPLAAAAAAPPVKRELARKSASIAAQPAASTEQESPALAGAPVPAAAQEPESLQPPLQPAAESGVAADEKRVRQTIEDWLRAWMAQDIGAYLAFYAKEFKTSDNEPRRKWEQTRRSRVLRPRKIVIRLSSLQVQMADAEHATAIFRQDYQSDSYADKVFKELTFIKENGVWRIRQERVVKARVLPQDG